MCINMHVHVERRGLGSEATYEFIRNEESMATYKDTQIMVCINDDEMLFSREGPGAALLQMQCFAHMESRVCAPTQASLDVCMCAQISVGVHACPYTYEHT